LFILDHNFWTRNARKLIKGSKDSDSSLFLMKPSAKHFGLAVGLKARGNMSQNNSKTTSLMMSVTKNPHPPTKKIFFECNLLDWPIRLSPWTAL